MTKTFVIVPKWKKNNNTHTHKYKTYMFAKSKQWRWSLIGNFFSSMKKQQQQIDKNIHTHTQGIYKN